MKRKIIIEARVEIPVPEAYEITDELVNQLAKNTVEALELEVDEGTTVEAFAELREVD